MLSKRFERFKRRRNKQTHSGRCSVRESDLWNLMHLAVRRKSGRKWVLVLWRSPDHGLCVVFAELSAPSSPRVQQLARKWCAALRKPKIYLCRINSSQFIFFVCCFCVLFSSPTAQTILRCLWLLLDLNLNGDRTMACLWCLFIYRARNDGTKNLDITIYALCFVRDSCVVYLAVEMLPQSADLSALNADRLLVGCQTYNMCYRLRASTAWPEEKTIEERDIEMPTVFAESALSLSAHKIVIQRIDCTRRDFKLN